MKDRKIATGSLLNRYLTGHALRAGALLVAVALPGILAGEPYLVYVLCLAGIYVVIVLGLDVLYGFTGQVSIGHAAFFGIGAYTTALLTTEYGWSPWATLPVSAISAGVVALLLAWPSVRLVHHFLALVTIGFAEIVRLAMLNLRGFTGGHEGVSEIPIPRLAGVEFGTYERYYFLVLFFVALGMFTKGRLRNSDLGRGMIALRENPVAAEAYGVPVIRTRTVAFVISALYAGVAGWLLAHLVTFVSPSSFTFTQSMLFLTMLLIGGYATFWGPLVGVVALTFLTEYGQSFQAYQGLYLGVAIVVIVAVLPRGMVGSLEDFYSNRLRRKEGRSGRGVVVVPTETAVRQ